MIEVVGAGSIGLMIAAKVALSGTAVHIWTRTAEAAAQLSHNGIRFTDNNGCTSVVNVSASSLDSNIPEQIVASSNRYILLCVKQTALTETLFQQLERIIGGKQHRGVVAIIALQNGMGHLQLLANELPQTAIWAAMLTHGAKRSSTTAVTHTGVGEVWISSTAEPQAKRSASLDRREHLTLDGDKMQEKLLHMMNKAGLMVKLSNEMYNHLYEKLLLNAVINPLTALYDIPNGALPVAPTRQLLMKQLCEETYAILQLVGLPAVGVEFYWRKVLMICENTASNISSMLADVRAGRETEIMAINGFVVTIARQHRLSAPLNTAMVELVQVLRT